MSVELNLSGPRGYWTSLGQGLIDEGVFACASRNRNYMLLSMIQFCKIYKNPVSIIIPDRTKLLWEARCPQYQRWSSSGLVRRKVVQKVGWQWKNGVHQLVLFQLGNQASRNSFMLLLLPFFVVAFFWASPAQFIPFFAICTWLTCFHVMHSYAPLFTIHCQHKDVWATIVRPHPPARQPSQLKQFKPNQPSYSKPGLAGFCFIHFFQKH